MPLEITQTNEQATIVRLNITTDTGKPAKVDGVPVFEVLSGPATIVPAEDGLSVDIRSADDDLSDTLIQVTADADVSPDGVETITDTILARTVGARAKNFGLTADAPRAK